MKSRKPISRWQRASAVLPIAVLSAAWTVQLTGLGEATLAADAVRGSGSVRAVSPLARFGGDVPATTLTQPATVAPASEEEASPGATGSVQSAVASPVAGDIPAVALAAYQRAQSVIDAADPSCHLSWQLVAAIGRIESDNGQANGNTLAADGVDQPGIYGVRLDGSGSTTRVLDTDGGRYDHDTQFDRAVGPMQFIPSTWAAAGVDADGDGVRNPQDINDAALAAAVYLCSGKGDLATTAGQSAAIYRYNHSASYVNAVLTVMRGYLSGAYSTSPSDLGTGWTTSEAGSLTPVTSTGTLGTTTTGTPASTSFDQPVSVVSVEPTTGFGLAQLGTGTTGTGASTDPTRSTTTIPPVSTLTPYAPTTPAPVDLTPTTPVTTDPTATGSTTPTSTGTQVPYAPDPVVTPVVTDPGTTTTGTTTTGTTGTGTTPTSTPTTGADPVGVPTETPTTLPTGSPTDEPTSLATDPVPTSTPTTTPTATPTTTPTTTPSSGPGNDPTCDPTTDDTDGTDTTDGDDTTGTTPSSTTSGDAATPTDPSDDDPATDDPADTDPSTTTDDDCATDPSTTSDPGTPAPGKPGPTTPDPTTTPAKAKD